jgi:hypothetical protein
MENKKKRERKEELGGGKKKREKSQKRMNGMQLPTMWDGSVLLFLHFPLAQLGEAARD